MTAWNCLAALVMCSWHLLKSFEYIRIKTGWGTGLKRDVQWRWRYSLTAVFTIPHITTYNNNDNNNNDDDDDDDDDDIYNAQIP